MKYRRLNDLPTQITPQTTAGIFPEKFADNLFFGQNRTAVAIILTIFLCVGFGLRIQNLGAESLSEDELNKLQTVEEYRTNGLSSKNGEHPFLMKGMQTLSFVGAEKINAISNANISEEAALRFPVALFGTFSVLLIFLLVSELFGRSIGLVSGILWAVEPMAIGFDRIAKEDSLVLFFFLLTNFFWIKSQTRAETGKSDWLRYVWLAGVGFAALMASKYYPFLLAIMAAYYVIFQQLPGNKWALGQKRWLMFFVIMGVAFLIFNPTIVLPDTWREMLKFSTENRIGHDGYEYMGSIFSHKMTAWLNGIPWTFYYVFIAVKTSLPTLFLFLAGIPLLFRRKMGDGRFFILFWVALWLIPYTFLGGKFTRYFTIGEPLVLIPAAIVFCFALRWITKKIGSSTSGKIVQVAALILVIIVPLINSLSAGPHFRLFTNSIGTSLRPVGSYFPHDEFYDASSRDIVSVAASLAPNGGVVACETSGLYEYYASKIGRSDLKFVSLSDKESVDELKAGDIIINARGRRYLSNDMYLSYLAGSNLKPQETKLGDVTSAFIYQLDDASIASIKTIANH